MAPPRADMYVSKRLDSLSSSNFCVECGGAGGSIGAGRVQTLSGAVEEQHEIAGPSLQTTTDGPFLGDKWRFTWGVRRVHKSSITVRVHRNGMYFGSWNKFGTRPNLEADTCEPSRCRADIAEEPKNKATMPQFLAPSK